MKLKNIFFKTEMKINEAGWLETNKIVLRDWVLMIGCLLVSSALVFGLVEMSLIFGGK